MNPPVSPPLESSVTPGHRSGHQSGHPSGHPLGLLSRLPAPLWRAWQAALTALEALQPLAQLAARLYVAKVFFWSGLTKVRDWDTTLALFADEYHVPLLPPGLAAWLGTGGELLLPVLLVLGMGGRLAALGLSVVNGVAVLSLSDIPEPALNQHIFWGSLLVGLLLWGPGRLSLDRWLDRLTAGRSVDRFSR